MKPKQRTSRYWQKRFELLEEARHRDEERLDKEIKKEYQRALKRIEREIRIFYNKFADANGVTVSAAKKMLKANELEEFKWDVWDYIEKGRESNIDDAWLKQLENASIRFRLNRLEALRLKIDCIISDMENTVLQKVDKHITEAYQSAYYHTAFEVQKGLAVGWDIAAVVPRTIALIKSKPWTTDGVVFSKRIWGNHRKELITYLDRELAQMHIMGDSPDKLIEHISKKFNATMSRASTLVYTESAYFASSAQKDCYNELDVERYEIVATLDTRTSETCRELDGEVFPMSEYKPWFTAPPFHCRCRSVTAPYFEDAEDMRIYRDADGNVGYVPASMKYKEWHDKYVKEGK